MRLPERMHDFKSVTRKKSVGCRSEDIGHNPRMSGFHIIGPSAHVSSVSLGCVITWPQRASAGTWTELAVNNAVSRNTIVARLARMFYM